MSLVTIAAAVPDLDKVIDRLEKAGTPDGLPYTREAVRTATIDVVQRTWIAYASGVTVHYEGGTFTIRSNTGDYLRSIENGVYFPESLTGEVTSTSEHSSYIENGQSARDMKDDLLASPKAKVGKDGKRYITVPFRHGTPGSVTMPPMPPQVYQQAQALSYSRRNSFLQKVVGLVKSGQWKTYSWGGRLGASAVGGVSHIKPHPGAGYSHRTGRFSGMVKMGQPGHSQYITFRRVSENSDPRSWQHPGVKPKPIRAAVVEHTRTEVVRLIRNGFDMDLYFMGL